MDSYLRLAWVLNILVSSYTISVMDKALKYVQMEINILEHGKIIRCMVPEFGLVTLTILKDKDSGNKERESNGLVQKSQQIFNQLFVESIA